MILWWCRWTSAIYYNHFDKATVYSNQKKPGSNLRLLLLYSVVFLLQAFEKLSNNIIVINGTSRNLDSDRLLILALGFLKNLIQLLRESNSLFFLYSVVFLLQALEELSNNVIIVIINRMSHNFDSDWLLILALGFFKNFI